MALDEEQVVRSSNPEARRTRVWALLNVALVIGLLYLGREVLIPVALAVLFTFVLSPLVSRLERLIKSRAAAVAIVTLFMLAGIAGLSLAVGSQFVSLARDLPTYQEKLVDKVRKIRIGTEGMMSKAAETIEAVGKEFETPQKSTAGSASTPTPPKEPTGKHPDTEPRSMSLVSTILGPVVSPLATAALVALLVPLMLMGRENIRDRVIRLAGLSHIGMTTKSLEEAAERISSYLRGQLLVNTSYAIIIGVGLFLIQVPGAAVLGLLAGLLRFIPLIGPWLGAAFPLAISLAAFDGWVPLLMVAGLFAALEIVNNVIVEPWVYGARTGISSLGVVLCLVFWTWVWGPIGLVMAVPITVCVLAFARQSPQLRTLAILLGDEPALSGAARMYQRLLSGDEDQAGEILLDTAKAGNQIAVTDELLIPTLNAARKDIRAAAIGEGQASRIGRDVQDLAMDWLSDSESVKDLPPGENAPAIAVFPALDACDQAAAEILGHFLRQHGRRVEVAAAASFMSEILKQATQQQTKIFVISSVEPASSIQTRRLCKAVMRRLPDARILVAAWGAEQVSGPDIKGPPGVETVTTMKAALEALTRFVQEVASDTGKHGDH